MNLAAGKGLLILRMTLARSENYKIAACHVKNESEK